MTAWSAGIHSVEILLNVIFEGEGQPDLSPLSREPEVAGLMLTD
jgi:hypothetical protein